MPAKRRLPKSDLLRRLRRHFRCDPLRLPVIEQVFAFHERPNLHLAMEELLAEPSRKAELIGIVAQDDYQPVSLTKLAQPNTAARFNEGPIQYRDQDLPGDRQMACVKCGVYFLREGKQPLVMLLTERQHYPSAGIVVEVMAAEREIAETFLRRLTLLTRRGKAYRGHVLALEQDCYGNLNVNYLSLPRIGRDDIILPDEVLRRVERHTLSFTRHADILRAAGRHIKRGILLHGPPGTGKTLTAMYLASQMAGRTVLVLTGKGMGGIEASCGLARALEPSTVIVEDVDLIGTERGYQTVGANALLFELLNQMDGLAEDADVLFLLTTNRPEMLEPALAARPGRIDQAIEVPLPDSECRRRLFALYSRGLQIETDGLERLVERSEGASGAFIRELLRKAAVLAAEEDGAGPLTVRDGHLQEALKELLDIGGSLTQTLLGARVQRDQQPVDGRPSVPE